jgi:hypothetical protein
VESQAFGLSLDPQLRVGADDVLETGEGCALKVSGPSVIGAKLGPEPPPRNQRGLPEVAHAVGEPGVEVERQRRAFELVKRSEVYWNSGAGDLEEEVLMKDQR